MTNRDISAYSDEELVFHVCTNSQEDYRLLVERYQQKLFVYIMRYIYDEDKAEDIVQEAFIKMYINLNSFDIKRVFSSWAYRITHNEMVNYLKKHKREVSLDDDSWVPYLADEKIDLAKDIDRKIEKAKLHRALSLLPFKYREILILYYFQGCDYEAISLILQIPTSTVGTRIRRAKERLKKILIKEYGHEEL